MSLDSNKSPTPNARLDDLWRIRVRDAETFVAACELAGARTRRHYFPSFYFDGGSRRLYWEKRGASVIVYQVQRQPGKPRMHLQVPPFPFDGAALRHAVERMQYFNEGGPVRIMSLTGEEALIVARDNFAITFKEEEYIFDRSAVMALEGSGFRSLRQELSRAQKAGQVETRPYRIEDRDAGVAMVNDWKERLTAAGFEVGGYNAALACLAEAGRFQHPLLSGLVVEIDGVMRGFAFSGTLSGKMGCNFICITDTRYRGLPHLLRYRLMELFPDIPFFNDSTDSGRQGLRELKQRFRPIEMQALYGAYLR
jgi:hypothetical protein